MRNDFHKVITERTRAGGFGKARYFFDRANNLKHRAREMVEDFHYVEDDFRPPKESMRKRHRIHYSGKEFSDLINPLYRFLRKQAGRPWNQVWSEICQVLQGNGVLQRHVKQHVQFFVDGIPFAGQKYFSGTVGEPHGSNYAERLYVDLSGILRIQKPTIQRRKLKRSQVL